MSFNKAVKGTLVWEEGKGLHVWWAELDSISLEMLEKWWCEVGGIIWWLGNPDFKWAEGEYVVRNNKVMWPRDLGKISMSLRLSKFVEFQLCYKKHSQSSQTQQLFIVALFQQCVSAIIRLNKNK